MLRLKSGKSEVLKESEREFHCFEAIYVLMIARENVISCDKLCQQLNNIFFYFT